MVVRMTDGGEGDGCAECRVLKTKKREERKPFSLFSFALQKTAATPR